VTRHWTRQTSQSICPDRYDHDVNRVLALGDALRQPKQETGTKGNPDGSLSSRRRNDDRGDRSAPMNKRFTASRVLDSGIEALFGAEERWQAWLAFESALT
jgi:hypothetical protein